MIKISSIGSCLIVIFILSASAFTFSCRESTATISAPAKKPNIIIVLVDALRASELGCYGYSRQTSPFLDSVARSGVRFNNAFSHATHSRLAGAALFTGMLPPQNGVRVGQVHKEAGKTGILQAHVLPEERITLAEIMKQNGYHTMALMANHHLTLSEGFGQGFTDFNYMKFQDKNKKRHLTGLEINRKVISMMEKNPEPTRPYFLYIHYMDVHRPYEPPLRYFKQFAGDAAVPFLIHDGLDSDEDIDTASQALSRQLYDASILFWDDAFKQLIQAFEQKGWMKNTLVLIIADHGEEFGEHGKSFHGYQVYQETLHIPMIVFGKGIVPENTVRDDTVQVIDIYPTLCYLAGINTDKLPLQGLNLFDKKRLDPQYRAIVYAETWQGDAPVSLRSDQYQIIYNSRPQTWELYDLKQDPDEKVNIYKSDHPAARELRPLLIQMMGQAVDVSKVPSREMSPETYDQMKALGYVK